MRYSWSDLFLFKYQQAMGFRNKHICIPFSASVIDDRTTDAVLYVRDIL